MIFLTVFLCLVVEVTFKVRMFDIPKLEKLERVVDITKLLRSADRLEK